MSKQSFSLLEGVIALGALVTSSAAVYIAWDQAQTMRVEQHASVLPALQIDRFEEDEGASVSVGFTVENAGVGPAFVMSATLTNDDQQMAGYENLAGVVPSGMEMSVEPLSGRVIAPGDEQTALRMRWRADPMETADTKGDIYVATDKLAMEICYCSTLQRCWISKSNQREHPKQVDSCKKTKEGLF